MKRQTPIQSQKETMPPQMRVLLPHVTVRAAPDHDIPSNGSPETRFGHDFSQVAVLSSAPVISQDYSNASCPPRVQAKLTIGQPGDKYEQEADRVADAVVAGNPVPASLLAVAPGDVQRDGPVPEKSDEEKLKEGLTNVGKAILKTPQFKQLLERVKQDPLYKRGKEFVGTLHGIVSVSAAGAGVASAAVVALRDAHKELPMQIPEIPLGGGHSVKLTINGPLDNPSDWTIAYIFTEQAPEAAGAAKPGSSEGDKIRAETARLVAQERYTRAHTRIAGETLTERFVRMYIEANARRYPRAPINPEIAPLGEQKPKTGLQLTPPTPSFGYQPRASMVGESLKLTPPGEQRKKEEEPTLQRKADNAPTTDVAPATVHDVLSSAGQPLDLSTRSFMESRFGHDFSRVRIHTDAHAAASARAVDATAYTVGNDIVFGHGRFAPGTQEGKRLIAHELTHVVQQSGVCGTCVDKSSEKCNLALKSRQLSREPAGITEQLENIAQLIATEKLRALAAKPGPAATFSHPGCPTNFCQPFTNRNSARLDLLWAGPLILAGIARKVNSRVVPLWSNYLMGGSALRSLTADFGADFTASRTTANTSVFLVGELRKDVEANQSALMGSRTSATIDFTPRLSTALTAITTPRDPNEMNFDAIGDIAGNVAGGIGTDQLAFPFGARPSPFNDDRTATITATIVRDLGGGVTVAPAIDFSIHDTIDLCPGNCGALAEQVVTIPLSRFEATGLVGDVPFTIDFPAPPATLSSFVVLPPLPPPSPAPGVVTASTLRIRAAPTTASVILGSYPNGTTISILCETPGETIDGNSTWDQTNLGFVSDRYVSRSGPMAPPAC